MDLILSEMKVPFLDVGAGYRELVPQMDDAIGRVLRSGWYIRGSEVAAFESDWASYCGAECAVGLGNGLDAIRLALAALGIGPGDEVIVPAHTFIATALAVTQVGATPVFADVDASTRNLDPAAAEAVITPRTRALLPVHLYGRPADMAELVSLASARGLEIVEDAAQAHGARWMGSRIGSHGRICCWSFYPGKNLGAFGDGGGVTTSDPAIADRIRAHANYGSRVKYQHEFKGLNSRLDEIQAAVLGVKLRVLEDWNQRRTAIARRYLDELSGVGGLTLPPADEPDIASSWHLFVVEHPNRDGLLAGLRQHGVECQIHYPLACHRQAAYDQDQRLPVSERLAATVLSLPIGPHLEDDDVSRVIEITRRVASGL